MNSYLATTKLYNCANLEKELATEEELTDEKMAEIVLAHTSTEEAKMELCGFLANTKGAIAFCKTEEDRIKELRQKHERKIDVCKNALKLYLVQNGIQRVGTHTLSTRKSQKVEVFDPGALPQEYYYTVEEKKISLSKIKEDIKAGKAVDGARINHNTSVQFK